MVLAETFVSEWNAETYREINELARTAPQAFREFADAGTDAGLLLFAALFLIGCWQARSRNSRNMAMSLLAPASAVLAYFASDFAKTIFSRVRPCNVMENVHTISTCPPDGDWSFPSNHATVVAACAASILLYRPRAAVYVLPLAGMLGFSRVFVGVHYPLDVAAGFAIGTAVAVLLPYVGSRLTTKLVEKARKTRILRWMVATKSNGKLRKRA